MKNKKINKKQKQRKNKLTRNEQKAEDQNRYTDKSE